MGSEEGKGREGTEMGDSLHTGEARHRSTQTGPALGSQDTGGTWQRTCSGLRLAWVESGVRGRYLTE